MKLHLLLLLLPLSLASHAESFFTDFEDQNASTVQTITINDNDLSLTLTGGTAFRIGNGALYHSGSKSWMLDPAGDTSRGNSDGTGEITFSQSPTEVEFYIRTANSASTGQVEIIDSTNAVVLDMPNIGNASWTHVEYEVATGDAPLMQINISASGSDMLAIDDFSFETGGEDNDGDDSDSDGDSDDDDFSIGAISSNYLLLLVFILVSARINRCVQCKRR